MVDRRNRDVGANVLQELIDGKITNDEFMNRFKFPKNTDPAIRAIFIFAWGQFSDLRAHRLTGRHALTPERRSVLDRCVLFLRTDQEFEWPLPKPSLTRGLLETIGLGRRFRVAEEEYKSKGDFEVWPFFRKGDYEARVSSRPAPFS